MRTRCHRWTRVGTHSSRKFRTSLVPKWGRVTENKAPCIPLPLLFCHFRELLSTFAPLLCYFKQQSSCPLNGSIRLLILYSHQVSFSIPCWFLSWNDCLTWICKNSDKKTLSIVGLWHFLNQITNTDLLIFPAQTWQHSYSKATPKRWISAVLSS